MFSNARRVLSQCNTRLRLLYLLNQYSPPSIERCMKPKKSIIFQFIVADKVVFGAIYSTCVLYTKPNIPLAASRLGKYPPPFTSTSVNNCYPNNYINARENGENLLLPSLFSFISCGVEFAITPGSQREVLRTIADC